MVHAPAPRTITSDVQRAIAHTSAGRHGAALALALASAAVAPAEPELLYLIAVNQRCLQRVPEALATLQRLQRTHPRLGRLHEERGHCLLALGEPAAAALAYQTAVQCNPALLSSWCALEKLLGAAGKLAQAREAATRRATLQSLPGDVAQAASLFCEGAFERAEQLLRRHIREEGGHPEGLRLLARIAWRQGVLEEADALLAEVVRRSPDYRAARLDYARVLIERQNYRPADAALAPLCQPDGDDVDALLLGATARVGLGDHEAAVTLFRALLRRAPASPPLLVLLGHSLKALGQPAAAIASYQAAIAARADFGDAYWSLANLKTYRFSQPEIDAMRAYEADPRTAAADRCHLRFALGKALEDQAAFAQSWHCYQRGNAQMRARLGQRAQSPALQADRLREVFNAAFLAARTGAGADAADPIFIVGLPRSGSTLVEQILASHSQVEATAELGELPRLVQESAGARCRARESCYPDAVAALEPRDFHLLGECYLEQTRAYRRSARPFFIDKMPNNFWHAGFIHLILPRARIIDVRRAPMACCFGNLKQLYASGHAFSYDMQELADYYRCYVALMRYWDAVLPGRILRVHYEDLVEDLATGVRRILRHCELPFEAGCIEFHRTRRSVQTASSEQVRQPIFRDGLEQWRNYEAWLGPLKDALGEALEDYRD